MDTRMNRRQALGALGAVSLSTLLAACGDDETPSGSVTTTQGTTSTVETKTSTASGSSKLAAGDFDSSARCTVATELTEGPYYFDVDAIRSDIREDREGTLLRLGIRVRDAGTCKPIENAVVDIWHCDALGIYSGFESASNAAGGGGGPPPSGPPPSGEVPPQGGQQPGDAGAGGSSRSDERTYLRGAQATNADGIVEFKTVYPGWYRGRTTHIHAKVHLDKRTLLTSQLFTNREFDERVYAAEPYSTDPGRDAFNDSDSFYAEGSELTLSQDGDGVLGLMTFDVRRV